jgi:uncharacterized glyoxalase superfamily protein PhnB
MTATTSATGVTITGLHHLVLFCRDTEVAKRWYEQAGFEHVRGYHGMHWFKLGDAEIMLHPADVSSAGAKSPAFHASVSDVDAHFRYVVAQGLSPYDHQGDGSPLTGPVTRPWGDREFELTDPDGHDWAFTETRG